MTGKSLCSVVQVAIGVVIAAAVLQTWLVVGWIVPVTVSGSSMAPALLGPHRMFRCPDCKREFAVGLDQLPLGELAQCPLCGQWKATAAVDPDRRGQRLVIDRTAFDWRAPRRWEVAVFRSPEDASQLCVKRVVGLPGETVAIDGGDVLVGGQIVCKSLAEQRAVRVPIDVADNDSELRETHAGDVLCSTPTRWKPNDAGELEYHRVPSGPITDEFSYNQGAAPPANRIADLMLTFDARLDGAGQVVLKSANSAGRCELIADFARRNVTLRLDGRIVASRALPTVVGGGRFAEWTFSLFDRQVLLAIGDDIVLAEPWDRDRISTLESSPPFAIDVRDLTGEIRRVSVWRDVYYGVRHSDGRQRGVERRETVTWRLGPHEFFVLGDNAAISDDSRSWLSGAGVDAKLLIGKPLGVR